MFMCSNHSLSKILQPSVFFPFVSHFSGWHELFLTDATTLVKGFVGDRQFNLDSPRMILTNVSWTSKGIEKLLSNENISLEQS